MAIISHVPFALCMDFNVVQFWRSTDVMFSLFWGLLALRLYHQNMHVLLKMRFNSALLPACISGRLEFYCRLNGVVFRNFS